MQMKKKSNQTLKAKLDACMQKEGALTYLLN